MLYRDLLCYLMCVWNGLKIDQIEDILQKKLKNRTRIRVYNYTYSTVG